MTDLVMFLRAPLDEDEAAAKAAADADSGGNWHYEDQARPVPRIIGTTWESSVTDGVWDCDDPGDHCEELRQPSRVAGQHIARHDSSARTGIRGDQAGS
jgi:hypothetical protein